MAAFFAVGGRVVLAHLWVLQSTVRLLIKQWPQLDAIGYGNERFFTPERCGFEALIFVVLWVGCRLVGLQLLAYRDRMAALELERQPAAAKLEAIQMQLRPHFLFNALNAVKVSANALDGLVPMFLLQPIVENAIKHGIACRENGGVVTTTIRREGERVQLTVRDNRPGMKGPTAGGHGIGLANTERRLTHFYPAANDFAAGSCAVGGFEAAVATRTSGGRYEIEGVDRRR